MLPVVSPDEMRRIDESAGVPVELLIERAGGAVAMAAMALLGGTYGRRVVVLVGKGKNGADGRVAARRLAARGVHVTIVDALARRPELAAPRPCDLVIDAVLGTGARPGFTAPALSPGTPVLAVDVPSGLDAATGAIPDGTTVLEAVHTVTFGALKPGHLFGDGPRVCGTISVADIGLPVPAPRTYVVQRDDVRTLVPRRSRDAHKWTSSVLVIGGSHGMTGAPSLAARAALRCESGMVRVAVPGDLLTGGELVGVPLAAEQWSRAVGTFAERGGAVVLGPGLGRANATRTSVRQVIAKVPNPMVIDADAIVALGAAGDDTERDPAELLARAAGTEQRVRADNLNLLPGQRAVLQASARRMGATAEAAASLGRTSSFDLEAAVRALAGRPANATILTPHDGEFEKLVGHRPARDAARVADASRFAGATGAVLVLKGPATVIAAPDGRVAVCTEGTQRLATAGSGDVLSGVLGALLAQGLTPFDAACCGVWLHGRAAALGRSRGLVAGDLVDLVADALAELAPT